MRERTDAGNSKPQLDLFGPGLLKPQRIGGGNLAQLFPQKYLFQTIQPRKSRSGREAQPGRLPINRKR